MDDYQALKDRIAELEERLALFEAKTGFMSAETMKANAEAWKARNPFAWDIIKATAQKCIKEQRRFSVKRALEDLRDAPGIVWGEDEFRISNSYSPVFARMLIKELPELANYTVLKRSKVDRLFK